MKGKLALYIVNKNVEYRDGLKIKGNKIRMPCNIVQ